MPDLWTQYEYANISGMFDAYEYANSVTENMFGLGTLFGFFIITFIAFSRYGTDRAFAVSSFLAFILGVIMRAGQLVGDAVVVIFAIATMASILAMKERP